MAVAFDVRVEGLGEVRRELRKLGKEFPKELAKLNKEATGQIGAVSATIWSS